MTKIKPIPMAKAKEIAQLGYDEVIIIGCEYKNGIQHITTYGKTQAACENAAIGGNAVKNLLNWPPEKCNEKPKRQIKREQHEKRDEILKRMADVLDNHNDDDVVNLAHFVGLATLAKEALR